MESGLEVYYGARTNALMDVNPVARVAAGQTVNGVGVNMGEFDLHVAHVFLAFESVPSFSIDVNIQESNTLNGTYTTVPGRSFAGLINEVLAEVHFWIFTEWSHPDRKKFARIQLVFDSQAGSPIVGAGSCALRRTDGAISNDSSPTILY